MKLPFGQYSEALQYLDSFVSYERTPPPKYTRSHYDLERFQKLLSRIGHPEKQLRCIHIAGTDGKGSTASFIAALLQEWGYRVGLYTSPHLLEYTERIRINGEDISQKAFTCLLSLLAGCLDDLVPETSLERHLFSTVFELLTAMAFLYFHQESVDYAVIETGLGGRLDATNVIDPLASVITPISLEHTDLLGKTLGKIAFEKAGIIKPERPVFVGRQSNQAMKVIHQKAQETGSHLFQLTEWLQVDHIQPGLSGYRFSISDSSLYRWEMTSPLLGRHQVDNLSLALLVVRYILEGSLSSQPLFPDDFIILAQQALTQVSWQGRGEIHRLSDSYWVLDGAHSEQGGACLRNLLDDLFPGRSVCFLLGFSQDKRIYNFIKRIVRTEDTVLCYQSSHPRSMCVEKLVSILQEELSIVAQAGMPIEDIISQSNTGVFCVTGSLFWVADVKKTLLDRATLQDNKKVRVDLEPTLL